MPLLKTIAMTVLFAGTPILLAAIVLWVRDRLTFRQGMSASERSQITRARSTRALNRWHLFTLLCACGSLPFSLANIAHQQARYRLAEAIIAIFFIFRYYQKRSEIRIEKSYSRTYPPIG